MLTDFFSYSNYIVRLTDLINETAFVLAGEVSRMDNPLTPSSSAPLGKEYQCSHLSRVNLVKYCGDFPAVKW